MRWAVIRHRLPSKFRCSLAGEEVPSDGSWQTRQVKIKLEVGFQGPGRNIHLGPVYIEVPAGRSLTAETSSHPPSLKSLFPSLAVQPVALALLPQASLVCSWFPRFLVLGSWCWAEDFPPCSSSCRGPSSLHPHHSRHPTLRATYTSHQLLRSSTQYAAHYTEKSGQGKVRTLMDWPRCSGQSCCILPLAFPA